MYILIIDNASIHKSEDKYYTHLLNGIFLNDLKDCGNKLSYFQFCSISDNRVSGYNLEGNDVKCYPIKMTKFKLLNYIIAYFKATNVIIRHDFIYFYYPTNFKYLPLFCRLFGKKYGLYVRGMNGLKDKISKWNYRNASIVFTVSEQFTQMISEISKKNNVQTVKPMIPFTEKDMVTDRSYKQTEDKARILYLGRIVQDKGIRELLQALSILKEKQFSFEMDLVGDGGFMDEARKIIKDNDLIDIVKVRGAVFDQREIKSYYLNADIFILPTYHEGFPRTLYEAMLFGTPILTTFVGGIPALMKDRWNCKEIKPKSVHSIVVGLEFALNNYDKMAEFAKNGTRTVADIVNSNRLSHGQQLDKNIQKINNIE